MSAWASPRLLEASAPDDDSGLLLYEPYYGLSEKPFSLSTDPRFLYRSASHTPVFQEVLAGIRRREGLVVLTGEIGMGKTTLCRSVLGALDRKTFSAFVPDPFVTREDLLKILLVEFGVVSADDLVRGRLQGASRAELSYPLYEFLRSLEPLDAFAVLLLDEAQNLPVPLLEEIRILSDLEDTRRLLQVVLIGQPELSTALRLPHMRQMRQRVTTHCELQPLGREGVYGYVGHRLTVAGATGDRLRFTVEALDLVFEASGGVPRVINRLCDRALQHGQQARAATIGPDLVRAAIDDLQLATPAPSDADHQMLLPAPSLPLAAVLASVAASGTAAPDEPAPAIAAVQPVAPVVAPSGAAVPAESLAEPLSAQVRRPAEPAAGVDDLRALLSLPPTAPSGVAAPVAQTRTEPVRIGHEARTAGLRRIAAPESARVRATVAAALIVLGAMSGMTLAVYWVWAGPLLTGQAHVPAVKRPSARIAAPLPAVLPPAIDPNDVILVPAEPTDEAMNTEPIVPLTTAPATVPAPRPAAQSVWVVQVGAFTGDRRANVLVGELAARGLTAFTTVSTTRSGETLHLVLVGPYPSREAARAGLDAAAQIPGVGEPILQAVPPARSVLR